MTEQLSTAQHITDRKLWVLQENCEVGQTSVTSKMLRKEALKSVRRPGILRYRILCTCVKINIFGLV